MIKNIIFAGTEQTGVQILEKIIGELPYKNIKKKDEDFAELNDGSTYEVVDISKNLIVGRRCDRALIQKDLKENTIVFNVLPCLFLSKLPEEQRICMVS